MPERKTVLVACSHVHCNVWCQENQRPYRDPSIIRILGLRDTVRLQGLASFELVVLDECEHYDAAMAIIWSRQAISNTRNSHVVPIPVDGEG